MKKLVTVSLICVFIIGCMLWNIDTDWEEDEEKKQEAIGTSSPTPIPVPIIPLEPDPIIPPNYLLIEAEIRSELKIINERFKTGDGFQMPIHYGRYGITKPSHEWDSADFAFTFVGLYGKNARVVVNEENYYFVIIGDDILEPNNNKWLVDTSIFLYRI